MLTKSKHQWKMEGETAEWWNIANFGPHLPDHASSETLTLPRCTQEAWTDTKLLFFCSSKVSLSWRDDGGMVKWLKSKRCVEFCRSVGCISWLNSYLKSFWVSALLKMSAQSGMQTVIAWPFESSRIRNHPEAKGVQLPWVKRDGWRTSSSFHKSRVNYFSIQQLHREESTLLEFLLYHEMLETQLFSSARSFTNPGPATNTHFTKSRFTWSLMPW